MMAALISAGHAAAAATVVDTLTVSGDTITYAGSLGASPPTLDFNVGSSKIYDDAQMHIVTDDNLYLDAVDVWSSGVVHVQGLGVSGNVIEFKGGGIGAGNVPTLNFNQGASRIKEDGQLRLSTDDYIMLDAPTEVQVLADLLVGDDMVVTDAFSVNGNVTVGNAPPDTLTVNATSTFTQPVAFNGTVTVATLVPMPDCG